MSRSSRGWRISTTEESCPFPPSFFILISTLNSINPNKASINSPFYLSLEGAVGQISWLDQQVGFPVS